MSDLPHRPMPRPSRPRGSVGSQPGDGPAPPEMAPKAESRAPMTPPRREERSRSPRRADASGGGVIPPWRRPTPTQPACPPPQGPLLAKAGPRPPPAPPSGRVKAAAGPRQPAKPPSERVKVMAGPRQPAKPPPAKVAAAGAEPMPPAGPRPPPAPSVLAPAAVASPPAQQAPAPAKGVRAPLAPGQHHVSQKPVVEAKV
jgi:WAS/WASL-interacting protein